MSNTKSDSATSRVWLWKTILLLPSVSLLICRRRSYRDPPLEPGVRLTAELVWTAAVKADTGARHSAAPFLAEARVVTCSQTTS